MLKLAIDIFGKYLITSDRESAHNGRDRSKLISDDLRPYRHLLETLKENKRVGLPSKMLTGFALGYTKIGGSIIIRK